MMFTLVMPTAAWAEGEPSATIGDITIDGTVGSQITDKDITISITNDSIKDEIQKGTDLSSWIINIPAGLIAKAKETVSASATSVILAVSGTPTKDSTSEIQITIPGSCLTNNSDLAVEENVNAKFAIEPSDADKVAADKAALTEDVIKGGNANLDNVTEKLNLVSSITNGAGCTISWGSSNESVVATNGTVSRPAYGSSDATVILTATITSGSASDTKEFTVIVKAQEPSDADKVSNITAANTLLVGRYAFSLNNESYTLNNYLAAVDEWIYKTDTYHIYYYTGEKWYDLVKDPELKNAIENIDSINGDGTYSYMNMVKVK
ncbi:MAG: hypothetical protein GX488_07290 [Clostridiales bacterium]|nr:hypothetical protein [Clostridiales bacterium]